MDNAQLVLAQKTISNLREVIGNLHVALAEATAKNSMYEEITKQQEADAEAAKQQAVVAPRQTTTTRK